MRNAIKAYIPFVGIYFAKKAIFEDDFEGHFFTTAFAQAVYVVLAVAFLSNLLK